MQTHCGIETLWQCMGWCKKSRCSRHSLLVCLFCLAKQILVGVGSKLGFLADMAHAECFLVWLCLQKMHTCCTTRRLGFRVLEQAEGQLLLTQQYCVRIIHLSRPLSGELDKIGVAWSKGEPGEQRKADDQQKVCALPLCSSPP